MSDDDTRRIYAIILLLLVIAAMLVFLDWRRAGEIELLHERLDAVDNRPIARILRATDDATAETIAKEGQ